MNDLGSNANGTAVSLQTWNSYFDRAQMRPTFVCSKPNRIPRKENCIKLYHILKVYVWQNHFMIAAQSHAVWADCE
jgi:hypothetical protein